MHCANKATGTCDASSYAWFIRRMATSLLALASAMLLAAVLLPAKALAQSESAPPAPSSLIVKLVPGLTIDQQAAVITRNGGVETSTVPALRLHIVDVGADQLDQALAKYQADSQVVRVEVNNVRQSNTTPSDPLYSQQWALPRIGWDLAFGSANPIANVVVAVLDTGIEGSHPDLAANVIAGTSMLDGSNGLTDPSGHGTMVAGTIAARTNTTPPEGVAGVAYAGVRLLPVTVLNADGLGQDSDIIGGVIWAVDHGADVILMAFSNPGFSESLQEAIDYAWSNNIVLVAATGNDGVNAPSFPAGDRGVIGVSATDANDQLASFSNYGASVFLGAPGTNILTTDIGGTYIAISGTSSSAAIVAGAAAQMMAIDPTLSNGVVVGRLARTADPAGTQDETGNGRINLARALLDTGTDFVQPTGAAPVGDGGPFVGPYRAAARNLNVAFAGVGGGSLAISVNLGNIGYPTTGSGACTGATGNGTASVAIVGSCNLNLSSNSAVATVTATPDSTSVFGGWTVALGACSGTANPCSTGALGGGQNMLTAAFNAKPATSLAVSAATGSYGGIANLAATLTSAGSGLNGKSIAFTLNGVAVGSATTNASGVATLSNVTLAGINSAAYATGVGASFAGDSGFGASSSTAQLTVNPAVSTTTIGCPASVTYSGAAQTPCTASFSTSDGLTGSLPVTYVNNVNAGTATASATYAGDSNHTGSSNSKTFAINQAGSTTTLTCPASVTYNGAAQTPCSTSVTGAGGLNLTPTPTYSNNTNAGTATVSYTFAGDANHTGSSDSKNFTIDKASTTTSVTSSLNPSTADDSVTFTATVTPATAGGAVQFVIDGNNVGAPVPMVSGAAILTTSTLTTAKTYTVEADYSGNTNFNGSSGILAGGQVVNAGAPAKLAFVVQPTDTPAGQSIAPAVTVRILDAADNPTTSTASVSVAADGPAGFTGASTTTAMAVAGVATFGSLHLNTAGSYTIGAASTGLIAATSNTFSVTPGPAATFAFDVPGSITAGQSFSFTLTAKDQFDNTATGYIGTVHFTSTDAQAMLPPDTPFVAGELGVTTLTLATVLKTAGNHTITASDTAAVTPTITGTSPTITVNPGNATILLVTAPAAAVAGAPIDVTVEARDGFGNTATAYVGPIHFDITDPKADPVADFTFVPATDHGIHTFSVTLRKAGQWTVKTTDTGALFSGTSGTIAVQPGPPAKLAFLTQPGNTFVGVAIPDFDVAVQDADDNVVDSSGAAITMAIGNNPTGVAVLSGTATVNAVNGIATFDGLKLNKATPGYTLVASSGTLSEATSDSFDVGKGTATLSLSGLSHTYDGVQKSATVTTSPAGLSGVLVTYDGSSTAPTNAGSYAVIASLDNPDYAATNATGTLIIDKATSTTVVTCPASVIYNGMAQTPCTANVTGAGGLNQSLTVSYTNNTAAGTATASAAFDGDANHLGSNDSKNFTIEKASSTTAVSCPASVTYSGAAQTPCTASVSGSGGLNQSLAPSYLNNVSAGTATASASYAGDANHLGSNDSKNFTIEKAPSTTTVSCPASVTYSGAAQTPCTASVSGAGGLNQSLAPSYLNNVNAGTAMVNASFAGDANHNGSNDSKTFIISKATTDTVLTSTPNPTNVGQSVTFTATVAPNAVPGTVTFREGANVLGTAGVSGGVATFSTSTPPAGPHTVAAEYGETANYFGSTSSAITQNVNGAPSSVTIGLSSTSINENDSVTLNGTFVDAYDYFAGSHTIVINWGDGSANTTSSVAGGAGSFNIPQAVHTYLDDNPADSYAITVTVTDSGGLSAVGTSSIAVGNAPPVISEVGGPVDPTALGGAAIITAKFTDAGSKDTHTCTFKWYDSTPDAVVTAAGTGNGSCSANHTYQLSNVYPVEVTVTDDDTGSAKSYFQYVVVYDATNGFVTGGGWINSPSGAYVANAALVGKANFGFVSKYQKGANVPTGNTEFQFQTANFNFKSTVYEWLVIAGAKAQYKGSGTINGSGDYGFMLTAIDGKVNGGGGVDKFRLKVWDKPTGNILYDNQLGAADTGDPTTTLGGGSIVIHK